MIAKQIKGKNFIGAFSYNEKKMNIADKNKRAEILGTNLTSLKKGMIDKEIRMVRSLRPNLKKYFYHTALSFHPSEQIDNATMKKIAHFYMNESGFNANQYVIFRHHDAEHPHVHLLINRIRFDGTVVSDSNDYKRSERIVREIETEFKLRPNVSSEKALFKAPKKNELEMVLRTKTPSKKMILQKLLKSVLSKSANIQEFIRACEKEKIHLLFNQASTGRVSGISYIYDGFKFKGQQIGNNFKFSNIAKTLHYEQDRDRSAITGANERNAESRKSEGIENFTGRTANENCDRNNNGIQENHSRNRGFSR